MKKEDAIYFAGLMEDYLHIPSFLCETIEKDLSDGKYKEVIEYIIQRKRELEENSYFKNTEEMPKVSLMVNEDQNLLDKGEQNMKLLKNKFFWEIIIGSISIIISLGTTILIVMALIKYIFG